MLIRFSLSLLMTMLLLVATSYAGNRNNAIKLYDKGVNLLYDKGDQAISAAIDLFNQSIKEDTSYLTAYQGLADALVLKYELSDNGDTAWLKQAIGLLDKILESKPGTARAYFTKSTAYFDLLDNERGIRALKKAHLLASDDKLINQAYFYYLLDSKHIVEAEEFYISASKELDNHANLLLALAKAYQERKEYARAIDYYIQTLKCDGKSHSAYFGMSYCYAELGELDKAIEAGKKYLKVEPDDIAAMNNLALYYEKTKNKKDAHIIWETIKNHPKASMIYQRRAESHLSKSSH